MSALTSLSNGYHDQPSLCTNATPLLKTVNEAEDSVFTSRPKIVKDSIIGKNGFALRETVASSLENHSEQRRKCYLGR